jgi:hypothetical protein
LERPEEGGEYRGKEESVGGEEEAKDAVVVEAVCMREVGGDCDGGKKTARTGLRGHGFLF